VSFGKVSLGKVSFGRLKFGQVRDEHQQKMSTDKGNVLITIQMRLLDAVDSVPASEQEPNQYRAADTEYCVSDVVTSPAK
jgi:hypothetical protein